MNLPARSFSERLAKSRAQTVVCQKYQPQAEFSQEAVETVLETPTTRKGVFSHMVEEREAKVIKLPNTLVDARVEELHPDAQAPPIAMERPSEADSIPALFLAFSLGLVVAAVLFTSIAPGLRVIVALAAVPTLAWLSYQRGLQAGRYSSS
jgi:hypothetical protein